MKTIYIDAVIWAEAQRTTDNMSKLVEGLLEANNETAEKKVQDNELKAAKEELELMKAKLIAEQAKLKQAEQEIEDNKPAFVIE